MCSSDLGRGRRVWTVPPAEVLKLGEHHGKRLDVPKVITPTQAKKLLDEAVVEKYSNVVPGALRLVESSNADAAKVFKKEKQ